MRVFALSGLTYSLQLRACVVRFSPVDERVGFLCLQVGEWVLTAKHYRVLYVLGIFHRGPEVYPIVTTHVSVEGHFNSWVKMVFWRGVTVSKGLSDLNLNDDLSHTCATYNLSKALTIVTKKKKCP